MYVRSKTRGAVAIAANKVDLLSVHLNSPDVKARGHVIQGRWPFVYSRYGVERRKGDTTRILGDHPPNVAMVKVRVITKRYGGIDVDRRLTRRLFVNTIAGSLLFGGQSSSLTTAAPAHQQHAQTCVTSLCSQCIHQLLVIYR